MRTVELRDVSADGGRIMSMLIAEQAIVDSLRLVPVERWGEVLNFLDTLRNAEPEIVLESFEGCVDQIDGETAYVTLESREHGDILSGEYSAEQLRQKGIEDQSRFLCKTVKVGGATRVEFELLPDIQVTDEEVRAIAERVNRAFPSDDPSVEY